MNAIAALTHLCEWLLNRSWQAGVLVLCVLLIQWLGRRTLTNRWRFALWWIVVARLLLPFGPASQLSLFNCFRPFQNAHIVIHEASAPASALIATPGAALANPSPLNQSIQTPPEAGVSEPTTVIGAFPESNKPLPPKTAGENPARQFAAPRLPETIFAIAMACWIAGVLFLTGFVLIQVVRLTQRLSKTATGADARACGLLMDCCHELRVRRKIELLETDAVKSPALFGLFRLQLLLPRGFTASFDPSELRYIFLHELAHVRRGDLWTNCLVTALQILHWFNPLLWLGFARLRADRELACDELALQHTGERAAEAYGLTIIKLLQGLQRPSAVPGLVGILEDRTQMRRRISRIAGFKKPRRWSALAVLLLAALGLVALTDAQQAGTARPDLTGRMETKDGRPVDGTVFIYTAGPKVGTSTFCPSCYSDCQKSAMANARGNFKIKSLDPELIFRILAVAPGYKPKFVSKVDPANGPVTIQLEPIELSAAPPGNCLHGCVVDTNGTPIAGAVVEAHGIRGFDGGGMWGELDGIDPLAVTDGKGDFVITSLKPFDMMDVRVSARGYANRNFIKLASGNDVHTLTLTTGAAIEGRVLWNGKPLANVEVNVVSADRMMDSSFANLVIGTDSNGRFLALNLPPNANYFISGTLKSLAPFGAIPARLIQAGNDGSTTDAGDLVVTPGHRLAGRVVLADGKPLPPTTRLLISRDSAWDSAQVNLPPDGRFDLTNVPSETYSLSVRVPGYHVSPQNSSYDTLNPGRLLGRVDGDTTNLTILLVRGKNEPGSQNYSSDPSEWPQNLPLEGVGANQQADRSQDWAVWGRVTDAQTGRPLRQFCATPGNQTFAWSPIDWDARDAANGTDGIYSVYVDKRWEQPAIKIEAEGYLPQSVTVTPLEQTNADFALQRGRGPNGVVRLSNGKPAANADVMLICPDTQNSGLNRDGRLRAGWPAQDGVLLKTGPDGRFAFEPRLGMQSVAAASPDGFARVSVSCLATNPNITLEPYGSIQGTLERPNGPGANEDLDLAFMEPDSAGRLGIDSSAHTDSGGHFEFDRVPPGDLQLTYRVPVSENGWQNADLEQITVKPGQSLKLNINAPARQAAPRFGGSPPTPPTRVPGEQIIGSVVLPDGKPAANAQVALDIQGQFLQLGKASIDSYEGWNDGWVVRADQNGQFSLPMYKGAETVIAVSDDGFAHVTVAALKRTPRVVLQPWARIEGNLRTGRRPGANQKIELYDRRDMAAGKPLSAVNLDLNAYQAKTDTEGRFVFTYVPPGTHELAREVPEGNGWSDETLGSINLRAGETKRMTFGGNGRTVVGRVKVAGNAPNDWQQGNAYLQTASTFDSQMRKARSREQRMKIIRSPAYQREMMNQHTYPATLSEDGSFKAEDVIPGKYQLNLQFFRPGQIVTRPASRITYLFSDAPFTVPKAAGTNDTLVDVGTIDLKTASVPTFFSNRTNTVTRE